MGIGFKLVELMLRQKLFDKGIEGRPGSPTIVSFAVTRACNLRCLHCHVSAREPMADELSLQEAMRVIDELANLGTEALIFSGGEPLLRKNFVLALAEYCVDVGILPAMLTNGLLLSPKVAEELKDAGILAVGIPIDSVVPESHDKLRDLPGTFDKAIKAIKTCKDIGLEVIITTMALKDTYDEIPRRIDFLGKLGVEQVAVYDLVPVGRGKNMLDQAMDKSQRTEIIRYLYRTQETKDMVFTMSGGVPLYPELTIRMHKTNDTKPRNLLLKHFWIHNPVGCHAGIAYFSLRPNGDIYPCTFLPIKVGNIREKSIKDIWLNARLLKALRNRNKLKGECGLCEYNRTCGGCRGRAYAYTGDYLESDPVCLKELLKKEKIQPSDISCYGWCVG